MKVEKAIYIRLKDNLDKHKSKQYLNWVRKGFPSLELHHLFGSHTGSKTTDYMILPLTREEHQLAELMKSEFAIDNLHIALNILQTYVKYLESKVYK